MKRALILEIERLFSWRFTSDVYINSLNTYVHGFWEPPTQREKMNWSQVYKTCFSKNYFVLKQSKINVLKTKSSLLTKKTVLNSKHEMWKVLTRKPVLNNLKVYEP